jgi:predicted amidohydrolase YtcJ
MAVPADLVFLDGQIVTMDDHQTEGEAFAVQDGQFAAIGTNREVAALIAPGTQVVRGSGATVVPGLIDAHAHLELLAYSWEIATDCRSPGVKSISEILARLSHTTENTPAGEWILGQGNHFQDAFLADKRYPDRHDLDKVTTFHPIVLRFSLHLKVFNSKALEMLGVGPDTADAQGGRIERDEHGEATGRTFDMYSALGAPDWPFVQVRDAISRTQRRYHSVGVTAIGDFPVQRHGLAALLELHGRRELTLRVTAYPKWPDVISTTDLEAQSLAARFDGVDPARLRLGGIKIFLDGGLTALAAALHAPYQGQPNYRGEMAYSEQQLTSVVKLIDGLGYQVAIHAIGDRALDTALGALEALAKRDVSQAAPHRIEHGGNLFMTLDRIQRLKDHAILPVPQPSFIHTTAEGYQHHLGAARTAEVMPFRTLLDSGLRLPGNSDAVGLLPEQHAPTFSMWSAVSRIASSGRQVNPEQAISVDDVLRMYTRNAAFALGREAQIGSIETGKFADFTVFANDPRRIPVEDLRYLPVESTWVAGDCVYQRPERGAQQKD